MEKEKFAEFLRTFSSLEQAYAFANEIGFQRTISPLTAVAQRDFAEIRTTMSAATCWPEETIAGRVKSPGSQFLKHLRNDFRYEKQYDLLAYRINTRCVDDSLRLFERLRGAYPLPDHLHWLWDSKKWSFDVGARNTLNNALDQGYASLDFYIYIPSIEAIVEMQTRPSEFEAANALSYLSYKQNTLRKTQEKIKQNPQGVLDEGSRRITEWEEITPPLGLSLMMLLELYGARFHE
jgi:hypothetical protein